MSGQWLVMSTPGAAGINTRSALRVRSSLRSPGKNPAAVPRPPFCTLPAEVATPARIRRSVLAGLLVNGLLCVPVRVTGNGQPDASAGLPYHLLCAASSRVSWGLVTYRDSRQVGALLYIECQSFRSFRLLGRRHGYSLEDLAVSGSVPVRF